MPFSAFDTATRAHRRSELNREDEAALLFCPAAERADAEYAADGSKPNQAMNHVVRAGIAFNRAGEIATAEPLLRRAIAFDWVAQGLPQDKHMIEWAFYHLLLNAKGEADRFVSLFDEAVSALGGSRPGLYDDPPPSGTSARYCHRDGAAPHRPEVGRQDRGSPPG
ncbi:hypothetical protein N8D56_25065 (plasmid) [Devosia sp. A8/3-2]|nr:hypothetical protein N8D56_25065 [Devosia sp. A8/3-2]